MLTAVAFSYKKYLTESKKLSIRNSKNFSLDKMTIDLGNLLDKYIPDFPEEVKLKLPKLKKVGGTEPTKIKLPKLNYNKITHTNKTSSKRGESNQGPRDSDTKKVWLDRCFH